MGYNSHRTSSECWQRSPDFQKGKPTSLQWGSAKDKDKKEDKGAQDWALVRREGVMKEEYFLQLENPLTGGARGGASETQRGAQWDGCSKSKMEKTHQRSLPNQEEAHTLMSTHSEMGLGTEAKASGVSPQGKDQNWPPWRYSERDNVTLQKQPKENPGASREEKDHSHRKALMHMLTEQRTPP